MNDSAVAAVDDIVAAIVNPSESPVVTEEALPDQPAPAPEEALTPEPAVEEVQQVEAEAAKAYTLMYFCMLPVKLHRDSRSTDLLKSEGDNPTLAINVGIENGLAPKGWAYFYTGDTLNPKLVSHPSCHRLRQWHVQRFTTGQVWRGGILPSSLYRMTCNVCGTWEIINDWAWADIFGWNAKNPLGAICKECTDRSKSTSGLAVVKTVKPFRTRLNHQDSRDRHVIEKVSKAMDKQDLDWGPLLPRVYGVYLGRWSKEARYNIPTAWEPVDNDERWFTAEMTRMDKTATVRPYSLCAKLAECRIYPKYWYMLTKQETCGWVPVEAIHEIDSKYTYVNGLDRGWSIDLINDPPE